MQRPRALLDAAHVALECQVPPRLVAVRDEDVGLERHEVDDAFAADEEIVDSEASKLALARVGGCRGEAHRHVGDPRGWGHVRIVRLAPRVPQRRVVAVLLAVLRPVQLVVEDDASHRLVERGHERDPGFDHEHDLVALRLHAAALELVQAVHPVLGELGHGAQRRERGREQRVHDERLSPRSRVQGGEDRVARGGPGGLEVDDRIAQVHRHPEPPFRATRSASTTILTPIRSGDTRGIRATPTKILIAPDISVECVSLSPEARRAPRLSPQTTQPGPNAALAMRTARR